MKATDICRNDDGGSTREWADNNGLSLSANDDTGEDWPGCCDLDHKSTNVQECIRAYLKFLLEDIGYTGFRYDMVKGFYASFIITRSSVAGVSDSAAPYSNVCAGTYATSPSHPSRTAIRQSAQRYDI